MASAYSIHLQKSFAQHMYIFVLNEVYLQVLFISMANVEEWHCTNISPYFNMLYNLIEFDKFKNKTSV